MPKNYSYIKSVLIAIDQLINTLLNGWPDETISSVAYRMYKDGKRSWPYKLINCIFFWQKDHCKSSYESEKEKKQLPPELR